MPRAATQHEPFARLQCVKVAADEYRSARWLGAVAIVLQALILGLLSGARMFPGAVILLACWAGATRLRIRVDRLVLQLLCVMIACGFLLYHLISPFEFSMESQYIRTPLAHTIARFLICMQLLALVLRREPDHPPIWLAGLGAIGLPFAANIRVATTMHGPLILAMVSFFAVAALYSGQVRRAVTVPSRSGRWGRALAMGSVLIAAASLGGGSAIALHRYERNIEWFLRDYLGYGPVSGQPGFSPSGRLSDVVASKTFEANQVALRVFADQQPGYLRGKAFETYRLPRWEHSWREWSTELTMRRLQPVARERGFPAIRDGDLVFRLDEAARRPWTRLDIWPQARLGGYVFSMVNAAYLALPHDHVTRDAQSNVILDDHNGPLPYTIVAAEMAPEASLGDDQRALLTSVDAELDVFIHEMAAELFAKCRTPREKIDRVQQWFREEFAYQLGINVPRGADPLVYFLTERPPAHCEFFATGTALLLRAAGVPCRYVAGYVTAEENAVGGYWIARNKDAHAWVEAYDDDSRQWVIVESTPSAGIPSPRGNAIRSQFFDSAQQWWHMLARSLRSLGFGGLLTNILSQLWTIPGLLVLMFVACGLLVWKMPRWLSTSGRQPADMRLKNMHAVLQQLDRCAAADGFVRAPQDTLLQFAERLRAADGDSRWREPLADCYELYAALRFRGQTGSTAVERLHHMLAGLPNRPRRPRSTEKRQLPAAGT